MAGTIERKNNQFQIERGPGFTWSENSRLEDRGAKLIVRPDSFKRDELQFLFGYTSPSGKHYGRDIYIELAKVIELRNFLNEFIENNIQKETINWMVVNPFSIPIFKESLIFEFSTIIKFTGYKYCIYSYLGKMVFNLKKTSNKSDIIYLPLFRSNWRNQIEVDNLILESMYELSYLYSMHSDSVIIEDNPLSFFYPQLNYPELLEKTTISNELREELQDLFSVIELEDSKIQENINNLDTQLKNLK